MDSHATNALATQLPRLCAECQQVDFQKVFLADDIPATGTPIRSLGPLHKESRAEPCDQCRFFRRLGPGNYKRFKLHVRLFDTIQQTPTYRPLKNFGILQETTGPAPHPYLCVLRENARLTYNYLLLDEIKSAGVVCYRTKTTTYRDPSVRLIDSKNIDWESLKTQLLHCDSPAHKCRTEMSKNEPTINIFLIDCRANRIVASDTSISYLALSYVWGPQRKSMQMQTQADFDLGLAPLTVRDAAMVVLALGKQYLWVDRYCIDQHDEAHKEHMIAHMDRIYHQADTTIVALYGDHDQIGLPGISSTPRKCQPVFDTKHGMLVHSFPTITTLINESNWNTRGWTYQEARMSRRCLFFTEYQMYFVCGQSTWSEAVPHDPSRDAVTHLLNSAKLSPVLFGQRTGIVGELSHDRLEYSKRALSQETDRLRAFKGILAQSSFVTLWGIPIAPQGETHAVNEGFALGLLWIVRPEGTVSVNTRTKERTTAVRRAGYPTWSWVSVEADIYQMYAPQNTIHRHYLQGLPSRPMPGEATIRFWYAEHGHERSLAECVERRNTAVLPENSPRLIVEGQFVTLRCRVRGEHEWYLLEGQWRFFEPDIRDSTWRHPGTPGSGFLERQSEALVLVEWADGSRRRNTVRFVLMLLDWIESGVAERRGLLMDYRDEVGVAFVNSLPRTKRRFILQ